MTENKSIYVVPVNGLRVPLPGTREHMPLTGMRVEPSSYIARRLRDKSLALVTDEAEIARLQGQAQTAANEAGAAKAPRSGKKAAKSKAAKEKTGGNE